MSDDKLKAIEALQSIIESLPAGSIERVAMSRSLAEIREMIEHPAFPPAPNPNAVATPEDLEKVREMLRAHRNTQALMSEAGTVELSAEPPEVKLPVNVRLRCPANGELTGPTFFIAIGEVEGIQRFHVQVPCGTCGANHDLQDANTVIVPFDDEQIVRAGLDP